MTDSDGGPTWNGAGVPNEPSGEPSGEPGVLSDFSLRYGALRPACALGERHVTVRLELVGLELRPEVRKE